MSKHPRPANDDTQSLTLPTGPDTVRERSPVREYASHRSPVAADDSCSTIESAAGRSAEAIQHAIEQAVASESPALVDDERASESAAQVCLGSEVRRDVLTGRQTIFASGRGERPIEFSPAVKQGKRIGPCPFCEGNERLTPSTLLQIDSPDDDPRWLVRVVNNKYPAVSLWTAAGLFDEASSADASPYGGRYSHLFPAKTLNGGHEVIVESPEHVKSISSLNVNHLGSVYAATADRIRAWRAVKGIEYISVFKNVGAPAGASLSHLHSQLIATAILPPRVRDFIYRMGKHYDQTGCCLHCDLMRAELEAGERIVLATEHFVAYCPFAAPLPYLTRIIPRAHADRFEDSSAEVLADLAHISRRLVECFESLFPAVAYNHVLHTRPPGAADESAFHWSMEWMPRVTTQAGFEHASDCFINPTFPEVAASQLRNAAHRLNPLRVTTPRSGFSVSER